MKLLSYNELTNLAARNALVQAIVMDRVLQIQYRMALIPARPWPSLRACLGHVGDHPSGV